MKKILFATFVACAALVACTQKETLPEVNITVAKNFTDGVANGKVTLSKVSEQDVTVNLAIAATSQLGADKVALAPEAVVITAGETEGAYKLTLGDVEVGEYNVTVEITSAVGATLGATATATAKAKVEPEALMAVDMQNYLMNCFFLFGENSIATGSNYTFEWKFYPYEWHKYGAKVDGKTTYCNRLGQVSNESENGILVRLGDGGAAGSVRVNGNTFNCTKDNDYLGHKNDALALNQWHTLTITVDAENLTVYDNGVLYGTIPVADDRGFNFERLDLSMSWGYDEAGLDYPWGQDFHGYIEYIRFWDKTLTQEEIKAGLCKVSKTAENLKSLWMFNTDSGSVIPDQVGPRNLDFANAYTWWGFKQPATHAADAVLEQWVEWDEAELGAMCPDFAE